MSLPTSPQATLRKDLHACTMDGVFWAIMLGLGEFFIPQWVLRMGLGERAAGLVATLPLLVAAVVQLRSRRWLVRAGSYSRWMSLCAGAQALAMLPMAGLALAAPFVLPRLEDAGLSWLTTLGVFAIVTLYHVFGLACGPAWTSVVGQIIPDPIKSNYFARRSRLLQIATLLGIMAHGMILAGVARLWPAGVGDAPTPDRLDPVLVGCAACFVLAAGARGMAAYYLSKYSEPSVPPSKEHAVPAREFVSRFARGGDGRFLLFYLASTLTLHIAQPYFNPFMMGQLALDRRAFFELAPPLGTAYSWLLAGAYLGRVVALPAIGRLAARSGFRAPLVVGAVGVVPLSLVWLATDSVPILFASQVLSGALLATLEHSLFLGTLRTTRPHERTSLFTTLNLANEIAKSSGSLAGAGVFTLAQGAGGTGAGYAPVFLLSSAARLLSIALLARWIRRA